MALADGRQGAPDRTSTAAARNFVGAGGLELTTVAVEDGATFVGDGCLGTRALLRPPRIPLPQPTRPRILAMMGRTDVNEPQLKRVCEDAKRESGQTGGISGAGFRFGRPTTGKAHNDGRAGPLPSLMCMCGDILALPLGRCGGIAE